MQISQKIVAKNLSHPVVFLIVSALEPFKRLVYIAAKSQNFRDLVGRMMPILCNHLIQQRFCFVITLLGRERQDPRISFPKRINFLITLLQSRIRIFLGARR